VSKWLSLRAIQPARRHGSGWLIDGFNVLNEPRAQAWRHTARCRQSDILFLVGLISKSLTSRIPTAPGWGTPRVSFILVSSVAAVAQRPEKLAPFGNSFPFSFHGNVPKALGVLAGTGHPQNPNPATKKTPPKRG
jgi:hypothetical protein